MQAVVKKAPLLLIDNYSEFGRITKALASLAFNHGDLIVNKRSFSLDGISHSNVSMIVLYIKLRKGTN